MSWLISKINPKSDPPSEPSRSLRPEAEIAPAAQSTIYPPQDSGLSIEGIDDLVNSNKDILARLHLHAASGPVRFDERYRGPINRLAEHINKLPATSSSLFSGEAGLLRACIELAFLSFQASDGRIFTGNESVERRHQLEHRWRYVCFAAGLLYPLGKPLERMKVTSATGQEWPRHVMGVTTWAKESRIYVGWAGLDGVNTADSLGPSSYTATILPKIMGAENLTWLHEGSGTLVNSLIEIVSGSDTQARVARDVVTTMWTKVLKREEGRRPQSYGRLTVGNHLEPHLVGAMKDLIESGQWRFNKLPVIADVAGVYLCWPQAGADLVAHGVEQRKDGWPTSANVIAEIIKSAGMFDTARANDMGLMEVIDAEGEIHSAYKIKAPTLIFEGYNPEDYRQRTPKTLDAVLQQNTLTTQAPTQQPAPSANATAIVENLPAQLSLEIEQDDAQEDQEDEEGDSASDDHGIEAKPAEVAPPQAPASPPKPPKERAKKEPPATPIPAKLVESVEVNFSDLVPADVRKELGSRLYSELLGKLLKSWSDRGQDSKKMRMTDNGPAFEYEHLSSLAKEPVKFIVALGDIGLLYTHPSLPGRKTHDIAFPEGTKARTAIVLNSSAIKRLGMQ